MDDLLYKDMILDLYKHPLNRKNLESFTTEKKSHNPTCGDLVTMQVLFDDDGKVKDIGHQGEGCAISQAALSLITDKVKGLTKEEIIAISEEDMLSMLGIPISHARMKCALLGWNTLKSMMSEL
ncbi:MAG: Fe-S cluster protein [Candidatus Magasanikbacteria bacterium CG_4_9_14_0_2_um_filter_42_11]|uniref:Fe-S cluster protein n=2 Tax=Candidatus Magasanikiibacteriota TaxID=1752731 RepID=A0A2M8F969_9BACT|nr:MAG: Fe-S cluster protein [Candidatus Magasanikbacteria bacterium CG10_big_fil_rev_8_21_14_0_10_43_9]PIY92249.1 MAG: Fe-S cluster protein [Candidatus Magasanikbacteria bacterium CG_4_10_14_0_8_um_filter_42_12]PIZ93006.1 MAG: Fe-S cluster protein [Candidatus Magasanikbacteria bacterium CG_4_10_14_0_2_um_filter_41_10]PJC52248.1 MAG: Fe-S cluster protein [Candidatus Magasanikbacteria bacterium CG_4_9_14_0_2_um_filter_42_11]